MSRTSSLLALATAGALMLPSVAGAASLYAGHQPLAPSALQELRGGVRVAGFDVDFAVTVTSVVQDQTTGATRGLRTTFSLNPAGDGITATTVEVDAGTLGSASGGSGSLVFNDKAGGVTISHLVNPSGIASIISNRLNEVTLNNQVDLDVTVGDFLDVARVAAIRSRLSQIGEATARLAAGHR